MIQDDGRVTFYQLTASRPADQVELAIQGIANAVLSDRRVSGHEAADTLSLREIAVLLAMLHRIPKETRGAMFLAIRPLGINRPRSLEAWAHRLLTLSYIVDSRGDQP